MKKLNLLFTALICALAFTTMDVNAIEIERDSIETSTYIIGTHMFTRDSIGEYKGQLTTSYVMVASRTLQGQDLSEMVIYYKSAKGTWLNALTNDVVVLPEYIEIEYENNVPILDVYTNHYNVSYDLNGGTLAEDNVPLYIEKMNSFILDSPEKYGHVFTGWTGSNGIVPAVNYKVYTSVAKDLDFYANYTSLIPDDSCFTFSADGTTILDYSTDSSKCSRDVVIPLTISGVKITTIGESAFEDKNITSLIISDNVTTISENAFAGNYIRDLVITDSVVNILDNAFEGNRIENLTLGNSVSQIQTQAFANNYIGDIVIPNSVISIGDSAFENNNIEHIVFGTGITNIEKEAFKDNKLTEVTLQISESATISTYAFDSNVKVIR